MPSQHHYLGCHHLTFVRDKLERVAEDSEAWDSFLWAIIHKLVSQPIATLATKDLQLLCALLLPSCLTCFMFIFFKVHHHADSLARDVPCRQSESPSSWWRCPLWWFLWKPAKETSGQTWSGWWTAGGYIGSTRIYLQEAVGFRMNHWILKKNSHFKLCKHISPTNVQSHLGNGDFAKW